MNTFDTIWDEMKPTFDFLTSAVTPMNRIENTGFITRMANRILKGKKTKACNASSGHYSTSASSGNYSTSASSGHSSKSASSGNYSTSASSGNYSTSASSGDYSRAECQGQNSACAAVGFRAAVRGGLDNLLMCSEYKRNKANKYIPVGGFAKIVDGKNIKPNCWYICENKKPVEVDFTDDIFSRVLSTKTIKGNTIKEIIIDGKDKKSYLVISGDKAAHGETIAKAKADLRYKISNRDTSKYKDWKLTDTHTAEEIIEACRVITGACFYGTKSFCDSIKLPKKATIAEAIEITKGQYGNQQFKDFFKKGE